MPMTKVFFDGEIKYVSDSRRRWREDVDGIIAEKKFDKIQMLVHPLWYYEKESINRGCPKEDN